MSTQLPKVVQKGKYGETTVYAWFEQFTNGGTLIQLYELIDGSPDVEGNFELWTDANKWVEGLQEGEVAIKNYFENDGLLQGLIDAGIVAKPHRIHHLRHDQLDVCKLLVEPKNPDGDWA